MNQVYSLPLQPLWEGIDGEAFFRSELASSQALEGLDGILNITDDVLV